MLKRGLVMNRALLQSAFINKQTNHTCSYINRDIFESFFEINYNENK